MCQNRACGARRSSPWQRPSQWCAMEHQPCPHTPTMINDPGCHRKVALCCGWTAPIQMVSVDSKRAKVIALEKYVCISYTLVRGHIQLSPAKNYVMQERPNVFISATTADLGSYRLAVRDTTPCWIRVCIPSSRITLSLTTRPCWTSCVGRLVKNRNRTAAPRCRWTPHFLQCVFPRAQGVFRPASTWHHAPPQDEASAVRASTTLRSRTSPSTRRRSRSRKARSEGILISSTPG